MSWRQSYQNLKMVRRRIWKLPYLPPDGKLGGHEQQTYPGSVGDQPVDLGVFPPICPILNETIIVIIEIA